MQAPQPEEPIPAALQQNIIVFRAKNACNRGIIMVCCVGMK